MTKYFCDICGLEIDTNVYYSVKKVICAGSVHEKVNPYDFLKQPIIACEHCWDNIINKEKREQTKSDCEIGVTWDGQYTISDSNAEEKGGAE